MEKTYNAKGALPQQAQQQAAAPLIEGKAQATPKQQQLYDIFVGQAVQLAATSPAPPPPPEVTARPPSAESAGDEVEQPRVELEQKPSVVDLLNWDASPKEFGQTMFAIIKRVVEEGAKNGVVFDLDTIHTGAIEVFVILVQLCNLQFSEEQIKEAAGHMVGMYIDDAVKTGKMTKEQAVALAQKAEGGGLLGGRPNVG